MSKFGGSDPKNTLYCSFCGKSQHEVRKLIAGPTVFVSTARPGRAGCVPSWRLYSLTVCSTCQASKASTRS